MTDIHYAGSDGWPLYARILGIQPDPSARPAVVLMHGGGPDHNSLVPLADTLSDRYAVVLPDVRGYGRSACRDPSSTRGPGTHKTS